MARETEHCGQKQIRCAVDFCRGRMPTVCANIYTATDLCPASSSQLQRKQRRCSTLLPCGLVAAKQHTVSASLRMQVGRKIPVQQEPHFALGRADLIAHSIAMSAGNSRAGVVSKFRNARTAVKFFRISQLRRLCECEKVAAVCYRVNGHGIEFLLVQTGGGRWTFPKGSAEPGLTHAQSAALEAYEEAGAHGRMEEVSFSRYFRRDRRSGRARKMVVNAHLCEVSRLEAPLERKRNPTWFTAEETKRHLRKGRAADEGAEMARVVGRAVARIRRFGGALGSLPQAPMLDAMELDGEPLVPAKDILQKVEFTIVGNRRSDPQREKGPVVSIENSRPRVSTSRLRPLLRARNS